MRLKLFNMTHISITNISKKSLKCLDYFGIFINFGMYYFFDRIQDIPPTAFQDLHSLEWIKLYNNLLTTLHYELMEPVLDSLQHIDIHSEF